MWPSATAAYTSTGGSDYPNRTGDMFCYNSRQQEIIWIQGSYTIN